MKDLKAGDTVVVNGMHDLTMLYECKPFIGRECTFIKITKSGLYQVALKSNPKQMISVPKSNITSLEE